MCPSIRQRGYILICLVVVVCWALMGCGNSTALLEMDSFLQSLAQKVQEFTESYEKNDSKKIRALEKEIEILKNDWVAMRNEFADDLTPQEMEKEVEKFNRIIGTFNDLEKKKTG